MKFAAVIKNNDSALLKQVEKKINHVLLKLATKYDLKSTHEGLGGDPFIFSLIYPIEYICTDNVKTLSTNGKYIYCNPKFIIKLSDIALRILLMHEGLHVHYNHPTRINKRNMKIWNIAVDYIVNLFIMEDLKQRGKNPREIFQKHLGRYMTLDQFSKYLTEPLKVIPGFEDLHPIVNAKLSQTASTDESIFKNDDMSMIPSNSLTRELSIEEKQELERRQKKITFFYADDTLSDDMRKPEKIYDYLHDLLKKHPQAWQFLDDGDTLDDHMLMEESPEETAKRIGNAINMTKKLAGHVPMGMEEELGILTAPVISWTDIIFMAFSKAKQGKAKNDWTSFKSRPMFSGMLLPKKKYVGAKCGVLLDTSGSMNKEDKALGISQLQVLDSRAAITVVPADAEVFWDKAITIQRANTEELMKVKSIGGGGTRFADFFHSYEKKIGKCDLLIIITDGFLDPTDVSQMKNPKIPVYWLITSTQEFRAPFGRVLKINV